MPRKRHATPDRKIDKKIKPSTSNGSTYRDAHTSANMKCSSDVVTIYNKYNEIYGKDTTRKDTKQREYKDSNHESNDNESFKGPDKASASIMCRIQSAIDTIVKKEVHSHMSSKQIVKFRNDTKNYVFNSLMGKPVPSLKEIIDRYYNYLYRDYYDPSLCESESSPKSYTEEIKSATETIVRNNLLERAVKLMHDCVESRLIEISNETSITDSKRLIYEYEKQFGTYYLPVVKPDECICMAKNRTGIKLTETIFQGPESASRKTLTDIMYTAKILCTGSDTSLTKLQVMLMSWIIRDRIFSILSGHRVPSHKDLVNLYRTYFDKDSDVFLINKVNKLKAELESISDLLKDNPDVNSEKKKILESTEHAMFREYIVQFYDIVEFHSFYLRWILRSRICEIVKECSKSHGIPNVKDLTQMYQTKYSLANDEKLMKNCYQGKIEWNVWEEAKTVANCESEQEKTKRIICQKVDKLLQKVVSTLKSSSENSMCDSDKVLKDILEMKFKRMLPLLKEELVYEYSTKALQYQDTCMSNPTEIANLRKDMCETEITQPCGLKEPNNDDFDKILTDMDDCLSELFATITEDS